MLVMLQLSTRATQSLQFVRIQPRGLGNTARWSNHSATPNTGPIKSEGFQISLRSQTHYYVSARPSLGRRYWRKARQDAIFVEPQQCSPKPSENPNAPTQLTPPNDPRNPETSFPHQKQKPSQSPLMPLRNGAALRPRVRTPQSPRVRDK